MLDATVDCKHIWGLGSITGFYNKGPHLPPGIVPRVSVVGPQHTNERLGPGQIGIGLRAESTLRYLLFTPAKQNSI